MLPILVPPLLMANLTKFSVGAIVLLAVVVQIPIVQRTVTLVKLGLAIGKTLQPITDFPYQCRRIVDPRLEACEDMWLSETTRQLFLACSDPEARDQWAPKYEDTFEFLHSSSNTAAVKDNST